MNVCLTAVFIFVSLTKHIIYFAIYVGYCTKLCRLFWMNPSKLNIFFVRTNDYSTFDEDDLESTDDDSYAPEEISDSESNWDSV